ncbi:MAG: PQQ-binding-like beta-propeller repeat protein [Acidobacteriota bacterium]|nr:PQQ-binding-like beta-propeller repeat protein [Acidobacteriota bacterium]
MKREPTLILTGLLCAALAPAPAQIGRTQDWNTFGGDTGRSNFERIEGLLNKENVAKEFSLLYKLKLDAAQAKGQRTVTPPVIIAILISYRGFKELAFVGGTDNSIYAVNADPGRLFWQMPLIYSSDIPQLRDTEQPCGSGLAPAVSLVPPAPFGRGGRGAPGAGALPPGRGLSNGGFGATRPVLVLASDGRLHRLNAANGDDIGGPPVRFLPANAKPSMLNVADNVVYTSTNQGCGAAPNAVWAMDFAQDPPAVTSFPTGGGGVWGAGGVALGPDNTVYAQLGDGALDPAAGRYSNALLALAPRTLELKQYFTPPESGAAKNAGMNAATPVVFRWRNRTLIASTGKDGRVYLLDAEQVGGGDHHAYLSRSEALSDGATPERGIYGLASWEDQGLGRWIAAAVWGPAGAANPHGAIVTFRVQDNNGQPELKQAWTSRDLASPVAPAVAGGVVFALSAGEYTRTVKQNPGGIFLAEEKPRPGTHATLYALDAASGKEIWSSKLQVPAPAALTGLTAANGRVYFGTTDSILYCFGIPMEH